MMEKNKTWLDENRFDLFKLNFLDFILKNKNITYNVLYKKRLSNINSLIYEDKP